MAAAKNTQHSFRQCFGSGEKPSTQPSHSIVHSSKRSRIFTCGIPDIRKSLVEDQKHMEKSHIPFLCQSLGSQRSNVGKLRPGQLRWIAAQTNRACNGELYRYIADKRGISIQAALYEAFGLTDMTCGLPTFATCRGGPLEIIQDGISGFHVSCGQGFCPHGRFLSKNAVKIIRISGSIYPKEVGLQRIQEGYVFFAWKES
ncbi:UNVERIFIED_CONTAM: Sucrose synthase [Sesamum angustifolium]|uniref:sucrose synthase n=1 Tax=Sesamum angustifolium TaxID=2727405 RepID=A0AAW2LHE0_9LAMI